MKHYDYLIVGAGLFGAVFAHENGLIADTAHGKDCRSGVRERHHRLDDEKIDARLLKACGLLGVDIHKLLERSLAQGREEQAGRGNVTGDKGPAVGGFLRKRR